MSKENIKEWKPSSYLKNFDFKKGDWPIYMKTKEHNPYFAINVDGEVFFNGQQIDYQPEMALELMKKLIDGYEEEKNRKDIKINQMFGIYINVTDD